MKSRLALLALVAAIGPGTGEANTARPLLASGFRAARAKFGIK